MKRRNPIFLILFFLAAATAWAQTFEVEHSHFWRGCKGKLVFGDTTVEYVAEIKKHSRSWKYEDIQQLALAPGKISILTYDVRKIELGADQAFNFKVRSGTLTDRFREEMRKKLSHPLVSSIVPETKQIRFSVPARHRMFLSDSQGILEFGAEYVVYRSNNPQDSGIWRYDELLSMGSTGPFQLRIGALQKSGGEFGEEKYYVYDLKRRLTSEEYDFIWEKINRR
jgi:hypothetical protein